MLKCYYEISVGVDYFFNEYDLYMNFFIFIFLGLG